MNPNHSRITRRSEQASHFAALVSVFVSLATTLFAAVDSNVTGAAWRMAYGVTPAQLGDPVWLSQDADRDGESNGDECIAGTNPFVGNSVVAISGMAISGGTIQITFPTVVGKNYFLQKNGNLTNAGGWTTLVTAFILGDGNPRTVSVPKEANVFYRVLVQDYDTDGDQVSDYAENILHFNPSSPNSGGTGSPSDYAVITAALAQPNVVTVTPDDPAASEDGAKSGVITVRRTGGMDPLTIPIAVTGNATPSVDYVALPSSVTLPIGVNSATVLVTPVVDALPEGGEIVTVTPAVAAGYTLSGPVNSSVLIADSAAATGTGLTGRYYDTSSATYADGANFNASQLKGTRVDPTVDFFWNTGLPGTTSLSPASNDNWSAKFDGYLVPSASGDHTFEIQADDGARVYVNNVLVIDAWTAGSSTTTPLQSAPVNLAAGIAVPIRVEYYELTGNASVSLRWKTPGAFTAVAIPTENVFLDAANTVNGWTALYWNNASFVGLPRYGDYPSAITLNFTTSQPPTGTLPTVDDFSAKWEGYLRPATTGNYTFDVQADESAKVYIDNVLVIDASAPGSATTTPMASTPIALTGGTRYPIRVEFSDTVGNALIKVRWKIPTASSFVGIPTANIFRVGDPLNATTGYWATYYSNATFSGRPLYSAQDTSTTSITYDYVASKPASSSLGTTTNDNWSAKIEGYLRPPTSGSYNFNLQADDGARVYVNDVLILDGWAPGSATTTAITSAPVSLTAGTAVPIRIEYYELTGSAVLNVNWKLTTAGTYTAIPTTSLFQNAAATIPGLTVNYWRNASMTGPVLFTDHHAGLNSTGTVTLNWSSGQPPTAGLSLADGGLGVINFSATWEGYLNPTTTGNHTFDFQASDGARVYVDGNLVIDAWTANSSSVTPIASAPINLVAGTRYPIRVEWYDASAEAVARLRWLTPGAVNFAAVPAANIFREATGTAAGWFATYYPNPTLSAPSLYSAVESAITYDFGAGAPVDPGMHQDSFSVRWTGQVQPQYSEEYTFILNVDDGARLWINGQPLTLLRASNDNTAASYSYNSTTGTAVITPTTAISLPQFNVGESALVDFTSNNLTALAYASYPVIASTPTSFTINVPGTFTTGTGSATIDSTNKAVDWPTPTASERYARVSLQAGVRYNLQLDYYETTSSGRCQLYWYSASQSRQIIPRQRLYPELGGLVAPAAVVSPTTSVALVGGAFAYQVNGTNGATVSASGMPAWLSLSGGVISGTPPAGTQGDYQIVITATNAAGTSSSLLNLHVEDTGGTITREAWSGLPGDSIATIPVNTAPAGTSTLSSLEVPGSFVAGDNYGARIRGYLTAPTTGNYYFWIAANDAAELWISNDGEAINRIKRASVVNGTTSQVWNAEPGQKSAWLALEAGKRYYIEVLHKSGDGTDDNLAVGWAKPGQSGAAPSEVVPGYALSNYVPPSATATPGTLLVATMLTQSGALTDGRGTSTLRLSADETSATMVYNYGGLTGPITSQHIHTDPFLTHASTIVFDIDTPETPGDGLQPDGTYKWTITARGTLSVADIREAIKQGKTYINLHTAAYPNGEIRGNYTLAGGSRSFTVPPAPPSWTSDPLAVHTNDAAAVRFLTQATFGASPTDVTDLKAISVGGYPSGFEAWIENQFTKPASLQLPEVLARVLNSYNAPFDESLTYNAWWLNSIAGADQLRQRVAFALSEIAVVSATGPLTDNARALSYYYDVLAENAFGNFRDILEKISLTPGMGRYLDALRNDKPDKSVGRIPNENYAREIQQLFSIGLFRMWPDGTLMLNSKDELIPTYTQNEIIGYAHVFTGLDYGYDGTPRTTFGAAVDWTRQMREVPARHFMGPKRVLNNEVLPGLGNSGGASLDAYATHTANQFNDPAYQTIPQQELDVVHDQLFSHPNTGPFICRQLIQRLVTSNPSRDYLYRVVQKFNDNGAGVRGDMKAVVKAILLDYEARSSVAMSKPDFGKQREPVMRVAAAGRAFRNSPYSGTWSQNGTRTITVNTTTPHRLASGNNVFLDFTSGSPLPTSGIHSATVVNANQFTVNLSEWITGTYNQPAGSTTVTVTIGSHWLEYGLRAYLVCTSGTGMGVLDGLQASTSYYTGMTGSFTFTAPGAAPAAARTGNCMIPRFTASYVVGSSGLPAPNDRRVTMNTFRKHNFAVGDRVSLNFSNGNPVPNDDEFVIETVADDDTFTVLGSSTTHNLTNQQENTIYIFPHMPQPLVRGGDVNGRSSTFAMGSTDGDVSQSPLNAPTVFNFFLPDYKFPGALASQGITTPEFEDTSDTNVVRQLNFFWNGVMNPGNTNGISSFKSGSNALIMDFGPWMASATDLGLGAGANTTKPWTNNENLSVFIDKLNLLLTGGQLSANARAIIQNFVTYERTASAIATGSPCRITTSAPHNLTSGHSVVISGVSGGTFTPSINGTFAVTVTGANTFTVPVNCTSITSLSLTSARVNYITYNNTTPSDTNKRDRLRAVVHLILTSADYTIQR